MRYKWDSDVQWKIQNSKKTFALHERSQSDYIYISTKNVIKGKMINLSLQGRERKSVHACVRVCVCVHVCVCERETETEREGRLRVNFPPLTTSTYVSDQKEMKTTLQSSRLSTQGWHPLRKWCTHSQVPQDEVALLCINAYFLLGAVCSSFQSIQPGVKPTPMGKIQCAMY